MRFMKLLRAALLLAALFAANVAYAAPDPEASTRALPAGYTVERVGPVRWTYPSAAEDEARELRGTLDEAWYELSELLGARVAPELDIRIAIGPEDMRALEPHGRRLPS